MIVIQKTCENCDVAFDEDYRYCPYCGTELVSPTMDNIVYNKLREYRLLKSKEEELPPYTIFQNTTLEALSTLLPKTLTELENVTGIGPKRSERYGKEILEIIKNNSDETKHKENIITPIKRKSQRKYAPINIYTELKEKYPRHVIFIQNGYFFEIFGDDAKECHRLFDWETIRRCNTDWTGVPIGAFKFKEKLKSLNMPYLIVEQVIEHEELKREITEKYP